jgi:hypothetical protein
VYPRVTPFVGVGIFTLSVLLGLRASVHPDDASEAVLRESGLSPQPSISVGLCSSSASSRFRDAQQAGS